MNKNQVILERCYVPAGSMIIKAGEDGNCAYLIQSGQVKVFTYNDGVRVNLSTLEAGQIFGELSLIFDEPRSASVEASEDCNLIILTREVMQKKLKSSDPTVQAMVEMLTQRIVNANNALVSDKDSIDDLADTSRIIYQNILTSLPRAEQQAFQSKVLPKMDAFLNAITEFSRENSD